MKEVMRSQLYQLFKNRIKIIVFFGLLVISILTAIFTLSTDAQSDGFAASGSSCVRVIIPVVFAFLPYFIGASAGDIAAHDLDDKTCYYELMSGKTRFQSYFGRVIPSVLFTLIGTLILTAAPVVTATLYFGWGNDMTVGEAMFRLFLLAFPLIRMICLVIAFSMIMKKSIFGIVYSLIAQVMYVSALNGFFDKKDSLSTAVTSIFRILDFKSRYTYSIVDLKSRYIYDMNIPLETVAAIIGVSLLMSAVYIIIGYVFFHKDDLN